MTSGEIRQSFLDFFAQRGHRIVPSAPVIPHGDPTLFFTNAGMNQFKDVFLGTGSREYVRAADTQKCIRVSGKHNDLEEVGRDTYHHTFFEMLGNWSFGDYYKREAIGWAWELLTEVWGLEKRRLYATVYETDDEAEKLWKTVTDIDPTRVLRFGKKDNFWEMGETGPCGPCSEIHIDLTPDLSGGALVNAGDPRVMEIWNLVFIQNNRIDETHLLDLPARHVDTGMGFERICAVLQGKTSNYDTDVFTPMINAIAHATGRPYAEEADQIAMRVIADHIRMLSFAIADGALPGNDGRGYVLRRILRRAARFGRNLGKREPFIFELASDVARSLGSVFPEVVKNLGHIQRVIKAEEESFSETLDRGLEIFESVVERIGHSSAFPGEDAFKLYDTYGFPLDLTQLIAQERGLTVDAGRFAELMKEQRDRARAAAKTDALQGVPGLEAKMEALKDSTFVGYENLETDAHVDRLIDGKFLALDRTPFYVESGGQVDDTGIIQGEGFLAEVIESFRHDKKIIHEIRILQGPIDRMDGSIVHARVDQTRRRNIERNHTATHLLHEALRRVLGQHLHQQGSLVAPDRLRFDFNHVEKISQDQLRAIEDIVNEKLADAIPVNALNDPREWLTIDEARQRYPNVKMFFGDRYGDRVRIVEIDPRFSVELCGGTHVGNTRDIGICKIIAESSIASGTRRIEAVTGAGVQQYVDEQVRKLGTLDDTLARLQEEVNDLQRQLGRNPSPGSTPQRAQRESLTAQGMRLDTVRTLDAAVIEREGLISETTRASLDLAKDLAKERVRNSATWIAEQVASAVSFHGVKIMAARIDGVSSEELKSMGDSLRSQLKSGVGVLASVTGDKVGLVCVVTDDLIKTRNLQAGKIVGILAQRIGGGGGGRPHLATAGGKDTEKLDEMLREAPAIVSRILAPSA